MEELKMELDLSDKIYLTIFTFCVLGLIFVANKKTSGY